MQEQQQKKKKLWLTDCIREMVKRSDTSTLCVYTFDEPKWDYLENVPIRHPAILDLCFFSAGVMSGWVLNPEEKGNPTALLEEKYTLKKGKNIAFGHTQFRAVDEVRTEMITRSFPTMVLLLFVNLS
jgi:hypothetical protein